MGERGMDCPSLTRRVCMLLFSRAVRYTSLRTRPVPFPRRRTLMNRRDFLRAGAAGVALAAASRFAPAFADNKPIRAGLIGTGWYGRIDLLRLLQVAPAEVVS